ncbi:MAG TPA: NADPH-dependent glutamate synthase [Thermotogota bacterium]|nr:NADPH-dependent glutamate synthase [Thermotogota bacterium]
MLNRSKQKTKLIERAPEERRKDFLEVNDGYSLTEAVSEADRCLQCRNAPCIQGCPAAIDIPGFIKAIQEKDLERSWEILYATNRLPAICGRVCPQEKQCEERCTVGKIKNSEPVAIGRLERFTADWKRKAGFSPAPVELTHTERIAVVGSGPAGLTVAAELAQNGYAVEVFEALHEPGGVLTYGIPEFRLPKEIVRAEIEGIRKLDVVLRTDFIVGKTIFFEEIRKRYQAIFLGIGAGAPKFMNVPGTNLNGVFSASEFLTRVNLMKAFRFPHADTPITIGKNVIVVGGGNVAMDAARSALRLGAQTVKIVYRRTETELPARWEEYHHAMEEGVEFLWLSNPIAYLPDSDSRVKGARIQKMGLGEPDASGRRKPVPLPGVEETLECDCVIEAIGQSAHRILSEGFKEVRLNRWGYIEVDPETLMTSVPGVFAGGDIVTGAATVIEAMGAGKTAAKGIMNYLRTIG